MSVNKRSFFMGFLVAINIVLGILVVMLFGRITALEERLERKISDSRQEVIQLIKEW